MRILTIGGATEDIILSYREPETLNLHSTRGSLSYILLEEGKKIEVTAFGRYSGGGATNSAVAFKRLGFEVASFFKAGNDDAGKAIVAELSQQGIDTQSVCIHPSLPTGSSVIVPSLKGDRTVFAFRGANGSLVEKDLPAAAIGQSDQLYVTSLSGESAMQLPKLVSLAKKNKIPVAINPGISQLQLGASFLKNALPDIDILIINSSEAKQFMVSLFKDDASLASKPDPYIKEQHHPHLLQTPITYEDYTFSLRKFLQTVLFLGPRIVVVTHGEEGVYVASEGKLYFHAGLSVSAKNTLGAGDAFGATFTAYCAQKKPIVEAIRAGIINSAAVIAVDDAKSGLLTAADLTMSLTTLDEKLLQTYAL